MYHLPARSLDLRGIVFLDLPTIGTLSSRLGHGQTHYVVAMYSRLSLLLCLQVFVGTLVYFVSKFFSFALRLADQESLHCVEIYTLNDRRKLSWKYPLILSVCFPNPWISTLIALTVDQFTPIPNRYKAPRMLLIGMKQSWT